MSRIKPLSQRRIPARGLLVLVGLSLAGAASGQTLVQGQPGCRDGTARPPTGVLQSGCGASHQDGSVSSRLSQSHGVITPPSTDPGMAKQPPSAGPQSTPVIPPPGSPGGNPNLVPK